MMNFMFLEYWVSKYEELGNTPRAHIGSNEKVIVRSSKSEDHLRICYQQIFERDLSKEITEVLAACNFLVIEGHLCLEK